MIGELAPLRAPPTLDGDTGEWPGAGCPLNHVSQVVSDNARWSGPSDLSARLHAGTFERTLFLAAIVRDDAGSNGPGAQVEFRIDLRTLDGSNPANDAFDQGSGLLRVRVARDGATEVVGAANDQRITIKVRTRSDGFGVEVAVPLNRNPAPTLAAPMRLDLAVSDADAGEPVPTTMVLSGDMTRIESSARFARFVPVELPKPPKSSPDSP
jgi:hypothetical protein